MSVRGVPVQDLPENQDPSVQFTYDEVTKKYTPWAKRPTVTVIDEDKPKRRGRPPKAVVEEVPDEPAAEGEGE